MTQQERQADIEAILSRRGDNGGDFWATADGRLLKGAPFSTIECAGYLVELGLPPEDPVMLATAERILQAWREDGRFRVYPQGAIYPCQTAHAASALCRMGYASDARLQKTFEYFLDIQYHDGGWRCGKFSFGRGPETEYSDPFPTLTVLDAFRFLEGYESIQLLDRAVEFLLFHWTVRRPIGPCHYGIGTLFMQVEYPFRGYNLFHYVHTLSHYRRAREDPRFQQAFETLRQKTVDGQIVVQRVVPKLAKLHFCKKGQPSDAATQRYREILENLEK